MMSIGCDTVRELLPVLDRGTPAEVRQAAEVHLESCAECRAERDVLHAVARALPEVPAALEARVLAAQQARLGARRWGSPAQLAMAATLVAAVIGGTLLIDGASLRQASPALPTDTGVAAALLPAVADPLLQGSLLPELTEAELEALLEEMDS